MRDEFRPLHGIKSRARQTPQTHKDLHNNIRPGKRIHKRDRTHDIDLPHRNKLPLPPPPLHRIHPLDRALPSREELDVPPIPSAQTVPVLIRLTCQEDKRGDYYSDAAGPPELSLHVRWEAEVPGNEVQAAIGEHDAEEQYAIGRGANDGEAVVGEAGQGPLLRSRVEGEVGLDLGEPGGGLVVDEVEWGVDVGFAGIGGVVGAGHGLEEDFGGGFGAGENRGRFDVEGFVAPLVVGGEVAEDEGEGRQFERGYRQALDGAAEALDDEPASLEQSEGLLEAVLLALVPDFFFRDGWVGDVAAGDEVVDLLCVHRERVAVAGLEDEAAHVGVEAMAHGPVIEAGLLPHLYRADCLHLLPCRKCDDEFGAHDGLDHPSELARALLPVLLIL